MKVSFTIKLNVFVPSIWRPSKDIAHSMEVEAKYYNDDFFMMILMTLILMIFGIYVSELLNLRRASRAFNLCKYFVSKCFKYIFNLHKTILQFD